MYSAVVMDPLTPEDLRVIGYIEFFWHKFGRFPRPTEFAKEIKSKGKFPGYDIEEALMKDSFRLSLKQRGITDTPASLEIGGGLNRDQVAAIVTVVNFEDNRSRAVKLRELGIHPSRWAGWMKQPEFVDFLQEMSSSHLKNAVHVANEGLLKAMDRGDTNAIKFYYEMTDRYGNNANTLQNVRVMLARVLEAIQYHVSDPAKIAAIGADFEVILNGGVPQMAKPKELGI